MAADFASIAHTFVAALVSNSAARDAFAGAMHPPNPGRAAAVVSEFAHVDPPLGAADMTELLPLIVSAANAARAGGASSISASIMPGDAAPGSFRGSIMAVDADDKQDPNS